MNLASAHAEVAAACLTLGDDHVDLTYQAYICLLLAINSLTKAAGSALTDGHDPRLALSTSDTARLTAVASRLDKRLARLEHCNRLQPAFANHI